MIRVADFHYEEVPRLGTVLFSVDALRRLQQDDITAEEVEAVLEHGTNQKAPPGSPYVGYRKFGDIRLAFKARLYMEGAALICVDGYRVKS